MPPRLRLESIVEDESIPDIWSNPDVPRFERLVDLGEARFDCPYPHCTQTDQHHIKLDPDDPKTSAEFFVDLIRDESGTFRCDDCDEPLYGIWGDGDHE